MRNAERALFLDRDNITRFGAIWNHACTMNPGKCNILRESIQAGRVCGPVRGAASCRSRAR
jgi:hypothetical protein